MRREWPLWYSLLWVALLLPGGQLSAQEEPHTRFISFQQENDSLFNDSDSNYTHGAELTFLLHQRPPEWLTGLAQWLSPYRSNGQFDLVEYAIGQKLYTPTDKSATAVVLHDRPYAGYLFASASVLSLIGRAGNYDAGNIFEISLGVVGPSAMGEETQNWTHEALGYEEAQGWDNQLQDELALNMVYSRVWRLVQAAPWGLEYGVNPHLSLALGNVQSYGAAGVMLRLGDNLQGDLNPPDISPGFPGLPYYLASGEFNWYLFAGAELRLVAQDIFLDGNTFEESHYVEKEPLVGDFQYGVVLTYRGLRVAISQMQRSREFASQREGTRHMAVNLTVSY